MSSSSFKSHKTSNAGKYSQLYDENNVSPVNRATRRKSPTSPNTNREFGSSNQESFTQCLFMEEDDWKTLKAAEDLVTKRKQVITLFVAALALLTCMGLLFADFRTMKHFRIDTHLSWFSILIFFTTLSSLSNSPQHMIISIGVLSIGCVQTIYLSVSTLLHALQDCTEFEGVIAEFSPDTAEFASNMMGRDASYDPHACPEDRQSFYLLVLIIGLITILIIYILIYSCLAYKAMANYYNISEINYKKFRNAVGDNRFKMALITEFFMQAYVNTHNAFLDKTIMQGKHKALAGHGQHIRVETKATV